jgi:hypothetical protein
MGWKKNLAVTVAGLVIASIIGIIISAAWYNYADIEYQLQGPSGFYAYGNNQLTITLEEGNSGNIGIAPTSTISVVNANITGVSIPNVAQFQLYDFCQYNSTFATISNLTVASGGGLSELATITITPNSGTQLFSVSASVTLPWDWHLQNKIMRELPTDLYYNQTSADEYSLLQ